MHSWCDGKEFLLSAPGSAAGGVTNTSSSQASQAIPGSAATGLAPAGGNILFPTNQAGGMVALNTIPSNPQHLPSAFVLPSGHVIPVVSNPQLVPPGQPGGVMAAPGGSAAAGQLQLPHMAAGPGGAGQVCCVWVSVGVTVCVCMHERERVWVCAQESVVWLVVLGR